MLFKVSLTCGNFSSYRLSDHLGSVRKILDENRAVTDSVTYDAFGEADSTASSTSFLFTGRELDRRTGLYHYRFRTYRPTTGRFTSKDPLLFIDGANVYRYVRSNPVGGADPYGLVNNPFMNGMIENALVNEIANADAEGQLTDEERRNIARGVRKEMSDEELGELRNRKTSRERKEDIMRDINDRMRGSGALPPDLQDKLDKAANEGGGDKEGRQCD